MSGKTIALIGTLDTKGEECAFLRDRIQNAGLKALMIDVGVLGRPPFEPVGTTDRPNEHGAGIVKNATTKIIGKQPGDMTALREHVHLNETALNQIKAFAHPKKG